MKTIDIMKLLIALLVIVLTGVFITFFMLNIVMKDKVLQTGEVIAVPRLSSKSKSKKSKKAENKPKESFNSEREISSSCSIQREGLINDVAKCQKNIDRLRQEISDMSNTLTAILTKIPKSSKDTITKDTIRKEISKLEREKRLMEVTKTSLEKGEVLLNEIRNIITNSNDDADKELAIQNILLFTVRKLNSMQKKHQELVEELEIKEAILAESQEMHRKNETKHKELLEMFEAVRNDTIMNNHGLTEELIGHKINTFVNSLLENTYYKKISAFASDELTSVREAVNPIARMKVCGDAVNERMNNLIESLKTVAAEYKEMRKSADRNPLTYLEKNLPEAIEDLEKIDSEIFGLEQNVQEMDTKIKSQEKEINELKQEWNNLNEDLTKLTPGDHVIDEINAKISEVNAKITVKIESLSGIQKRLNDTLNALNSRKKEYKAVEKIIEDIRSHSEFLFDNLGKVARPFTRSHAVVSKIITPLEKAERDLNNFVNSYNTTEYVKTLTDWVVDIKFCIKDSRVRFDVLKEIYESLNGTDGTMAEKVALNIQTVTDRLKNVTSSITELDKKIEKYFNELKTLKERNARLHSDITARKNELKVKNEEMDIALQQLESAQSALNSFNQSHPQ